MFESKSAFGRLFDAEEVHSITGESFPRIPWKFSLWFFRERLHYTRERLAQLLGVFSRTVARWDEGETPTLRHQAMLLKAMEEVPSRLEDLASSVRKTLDTYARKNRSALTAAVLNATNKQIYSRIYQKRSPAATAPRNSKGKGTVHGNRGKPSPRRFPEEFKQKVMQIVKKKYYDFGPKFCRRKIRDSRETAGESGDSKTLDDRKSSVDAKETA
ncbi:MAG: hypothetical protein ABII89_04990 [Candidatus Omnitrophota bacterium]